MRLETKLALVGATLAALTLLSALALGAPQDFEFPGTQPSTVVDEFVRPQTMDPLDFVDGLGKPPCSQCHTGVDPAVNPSDVTAPRPLFTWQGSMMAQAARDPLFFAQLDLANSDHLIRSEVDGIGDMCLRCHTPVGWLEGRSTPDLTGMSINYKDAFGVQCAFCHRLVDPTAEGLPAGHFDITGILNPLSPDPGIPPTFGNGMYVVDPSHLRRGPYDSSQMTGHAGETVPDAILWASSMAAWDHPTYGSPFHRSSNLCGTCHDVSLPFDCADTSDVQSCFAIERTWTEWLYSDYSSLDEQGNCQFCHMSGPLNGVAFGAPCEGGGALDHLNDIHIHDLTGGNAFIPRVIAYWKDRYDNCESDFTPGTPEHDACLDFKTALEDLYPPAGEDPFKYIELDALAAGEARVHRTLARAAYLDAELDAVDPTLLRVTVSNRTGHKLPTGYPEGRRMWLNVRFLDQDGGLIAESGRYDQASASLFHDQNVDAAAGGKSYDVITYTDAAGTALATGRPTQVWEARLKRAAGDVEFHFALNDTLVMDNRIPPVGWDPVEYGSRGALPFIPTDYETNGWQGDYEDPVDGPIHYDDSVFDVPTGTHWVETRLYYQTMSREYIEQLVLDNPNTLTAGGYNRATLLEEAWDTAEVGRSEPVEMDADVVVVVDLDADGLPDGWEDDFVPPVAGGANDDDDGDGHNNLQELIAGTDPVAAADTRKPADIVLLLDTSGSMDDPAPNSGIPKIELLQDAVALFLETWKDYSVPDDRIGVIYFGSTATASALTPALVPFNANWEAIRGDVGGQTASGWTAMGAGLYLALDMLDRLDFDPAPDTSHSKHVLLFSNGMQNRSPIIGDHPVAADYLEIRVPGVGDISITGDSNAGLTLPKTVLRPGAVENGASVHTIGIGVEEDPGGTSWHDFLRTIADKQLSHHAFITDAFQLEGSFLNGLVETLRSNTLGYLFERHAELDSGSEEIVEFPIHSSASKFSLVVSWLGNGANDERVDTRLIRPDGVEEPLDALLRRQPGYLIINKYLDGQDYQPEQYGDWKLVVRLDERRSDGDDVQPNREGGLRDGSLRVRLHGFVDETEVKFTFGINSSQARAGRPLRAWVRANRGDQLLRWADSVTVELTPPALGLGTELAESRHALADLTAFDPDLVSNPLNQKLLAAFSDSKWAARFESPRVVYELNDDGVDGDNVGSDGEFARALPVPTVPGNYEVKFRAVFHDPSGGHIVQELEESMVVRIGEIDADRSDTHLEIEKEKTWVVVRPVDTLGNLLGPGYTDRLRISIAGDRLAVEDQLDGSYRALMPPWAAADTAVDISLWGETVHEGLVPEGKGGSRLWLWLLLLLILILLLLWLWRRLTA